MAGLGHLQACPCIVVPLAGDVEGGWPICKMGQLREKITQVYSCQM